MSQHITRDHGKKVADDLLAERKEKAKQFGDRREAMLLSNQVVQLSRLEAIARGNRSCLYDIVQLMSSCGSIIVNKDMPAIAPQDLPPHYNESATNFSPSIHLHSFGAGRRALAAATGTPAIAEVASGDDIAISEDIADEYTFVDDTPGPSGRGAPAGGNLGGSVRKNIELSGLYRKLQNTHQPLLASFQNKETLGTNVYQAKTTRNLVEYILSFYQRHANQVNKTVTIEDVADTKAAAVAFFEKYFSIQGTTAAGLLNWQKSYLKFVSNCKMDYSGSDTKVNFRLGSLVDKLKQLIKETNKLVTKATVQQKVIHTKILISYKECCRVFRRDDVRACVEAILKRNAAGVSNVDYNYVMYYLIGVCIYFNAQRSEVASNTTLGMLKAAKLPTGYEDRVAIPFSDNKVRRLVYFVVTQRTYDSLKQFMRWRAVFLRGKVAGNLMNDEAHLFLNTSGNRIRKPYEGLRRFQHFHEVKNAVLPRFVRHAAATATYNKFIARGREDPAAVVRAHSSRVSADVYVDNLEVFCVEAFNILRGVEESGEMNASTDAYVSDSDEEEVSSPDVSEPFDADLVAPYFTPKGLNDKVRHRLFSLHAISLDGTPPGARNLDKSLIPSTLKGKQLTKCKKALTDCWRNKQLSMRSKELAVRLNQSYAMEDWKDVLGGLIDELGWSTNKPELKDVLRAANDLFVPVHTSKSCIKIFSNISKNFCGTPCYVCVK